MKSPAKLFHKSLYVICVVEICDFLLMNFIFWILFCLNLHFIKNLSVLGHACSYWIIGNITYFVSVNWVSVIEHNRTVRPEAIASQITRVFILQFILFLAVLSLLKVSAPSRLMLVAFYVPTFLFVCLGRTLLYKIFGSIRYSGSDNYTTVLVGDEQNMRDLVELMNNKWNGYTLKGVFTLEANHHYGDDVRRIGSVDDVIPYLESHHVDELFCGLPSLYKDKIMPIIDYCENNLVRFYSVPNLQNYLRRQVEMKRVGNSIVLAIRKEPLGRLRNRLLKRAFDLLISTIFLCTLYPLIYIIIGALIKLTSSGPVYFKQARTGLDGRSFICLKFRSMCVNKQSDHRQATKDDPRITAIGRLIRHTNIDELPQFINVWKGDMSLVGPRPHMLEHTEKYSQLINHFMLRHLIKPGITGWAQVHGCRGETKEVTDMAKRVRLDIWYCENWNLWLDIIIVFKTVWNMIRGEKGAY